MIFLINKNTKFTLDILGYEFHNSKLFEDLNWLNVKITAKDSNNDWNSSSAILTAIELQELYVWLKNIRNENYEKSRINFIESEFSMGIDVQNKKIIIYLTFDFHPKGNFFDYGKDFEYELFFDLTPKRMDELLKGLQKLVRDFPVKYQNNYS